MPASIILNQNTLGLGTPGVSRNDFVLSQLVTCSNNTAETSYLWTLVDVPIRSALVRGTTGVAATFTFTPDVKGTYLVSLQVNGSALDADNQRLFGAVLVTGTDALGWRYSAAGERDEDRITRVGLGFPGDVNPRGWATDNDLQLESVEVSTARVLSAVVTSPGVGVPDLVTVDVATGTLHVSLIPPVPPSGVAGGDLGGTYPNPDVVALQGRSVNAAVPGINDFLIWSGADWAPANTATNLTLTGNLAVTGTVDGRDVSVDGTAQDAHIANTANPHSTSIANVGAGTLAQLNTAISDANLLPDKTTVVTDATIARTLSDADNGSLIIFSNAAAITVTVPDTLSVGTSFVLAPANAAPAMITVVAGGTMTLQAKASAVVPLITYEKWSVIGITVTSATTAVVYGDLG